MRVSSRYLNSHRDWAQYSVENTAASAKKVLNDGKKNQAAVASETAGRLYGLKVLEPSINHNKDNTTRFIILSRDPIYREECVEGEHQLRTPPHERFPVQYAEQFYLQCM